MSPAEFASAATCQPVNFLLREGEGRQTGEVDGLETGTNLLHGLVAGLCPEGRDERFRVEKLPELVRSSSRQSVLDLDGTTQFEDIFHFIIPLDSLEAAFRRALHHLQLPC